MTSSQTDAHLHAIDQSQLSADETVVQTTDQIESSAIQDRRVQQQAFSERSAAILEAVAKLSATLHAGATCNAEQPQDVRKVAGNILIKVIDLILELYPEHPEWIIPLDQLLFGLRDLDRGKSNNLFQPLKLDHRPPNTIADMIFRAIPAAAMTILMKKARVKRTEAAATIARKLNKLGYRDGSGALIKGNQVAQWREDVTARQPRELAARRYYDALKEVEALEPQAAVTFLLNALPSLPPPHFPQNPGS
jgi:hypothetical protein